MQSFVRTSSIRRKVSIAALTGVSMFTLASCEGDDQIPGPVRITQSPTMTVSPKATTLEVGGSQQLTAVVKDPNGNVLNLPITWTSSDPTVISVSGTGLVTALTSGNGSVVASAENGARSTGSFTVIPAASVVSTIEVTQGTSEPVTFGGFRTAASQILAVGASRQLNAIAFNANGVPVPVDVTWTSSNPDLPVNDAGVVFANKPGTATITATAGGQSKTFNITSGFMALSMDWGTNVATLQPGTATQITATGRDGFGNIVPFPVTVTLTKSANNTATLSPTGLLTLPANMRGSVALTGTMTDAAGPSNFFAVVNPLRPGVNITGISGVTNDDFSYFIYVPPGRTRLQFLLRAGTGDPDIFIFRPGTTADVCSPESGAATTETCNFTSNIVPGIWRVRILGFSTFAGWSLETIMEPAA